MAILNKEVSHIGKVVLCLFSPPKNLSTLSPPLYTGRIPGECRLILGDIDISAGYDHYGVNSYKEFCHFSQLMRFQTSQIDCQKIKFRLMAIELPDECSHANRSTKSGK